MRKSEDENQVSMPSLAAKHLGFRRSLHPSASGYAGHLACLRPQCCHTDVRSVHQLATTSSLARHLVTCHPRQDPYASKIGI